MTHDGEAGALRPAGPRHRRDAAPLRLPGAELPGVHYLRTLDDSDALRAEFRPGANVVVIGARMDRPGDSGRRPGSGSHRDRDGERRAAALRVLGPRMAQVFAGLHRENGVDLRLGRRRASAGARRP